MFRIYTVKEDGTKIGWSRLMTKQEANVIAWCENYEAKKNGSKVRHIVVEE